MSKQSKHILITHWSIRRSQISPYQAPECSKTVLCGKVYGHPRFARGTEISTSTIVEFDSKSRVCKTKNSSYRLGMIDTIFKSWMRANGLTMKSYNKGGRHEDCRTAATLT